VANLKRALPIVDRAYVFDNSREDQSAIRWVRTREGSIAKVTEGAMPEWVEEAVTAPPIDLDKDNSVER
jgi:predicted ABC-type ATPase